jgi:hypothetical protein
MSADGRGEILPGPMVAIVQLARGAPSRRTGYLDRLAL